MEEKRGEPVDLSISPKLKSKLREKLKVKFNLKSKPIVKSKPTKKPKPKSKTKKGVKVSVKKTSSKTKKSVKKKSEGTSENVLDSYKFTSLNMPISVKIYKKPDEFVFTYELFISTISKNTDIILERIRKELVHKVNLGMVDITQIKRTGIVEEKFSNTIRDLVGKYFPDIEKGYL